MARKEKLVNGKIYKDKNFGGSFLCIREHGEGSYILESRCGLRMAVFGVTVYDDGSIDWEDFAEGDFTFENPAIQDFARAAEVISNFTHSVSIATLVRRR